jgi:hypothetical protein
MHDMVTVGVPVLVILFGILLNQRAVDKLESRMETRFNAVDARFNAVDGRLDRMQADLSQFYRDLGDHGARIEAIEKRAS